MLSIYTDRYRNYKSGRESPSSPPYHLHLSSTSTSTSISPPHPPNLPMGANQPVFHLHPSSRPHVRGKTAINVISHPDPPRHARPVAAAASPRPHARHSIISARFLFLGSGRRSEGMRLVGRRDLSIILIYYLPMSSTILPIPSTIVPISPRHFIYCTHHVSAFYPPIHLFPPTTISAVSSTICNSCNSNPSGN